MASSRAPSTSFIASMLFIMRFIMTLLQLHAIPADLRKICRQLHPY